MKRSAPYPRGLFVRGPALIDALAVIDDPDVRQVVVDLSRRPHARVCELWDHVFGPRAEGDSGALRILAERLVAPIRMARTVLESQGGFFDAARRNLQQLLEMESHLQDRAIAHEALTYLERWQVERTIAVLAALVPEGG